MIMKTMMFGDVQVTLSSKFQLQSAQIPITGVENLTPYVQCLMYCVQCLHVM